MLVEVFARAHLQGVVVTDVRGLETGEQAKARVERSSRIQFPAHPAVNAQDVDVTGIQHNVTRQRLPHTYGPLLRIGLTNVPVDCIPTWWRRRTLKRRIVDVRLGGRKSGDEILHSVEGAVDVPNFVRCGIVIDPETAAQHRLTVSAQIIGEADARAETELGFLARAAVEERSHTLQRLPEPGIDEAMFVLVPHA